MTKTIPAEYDAAHKHSSKHRAQLEASRECACFYCLARYAPGEIKEWIEEHRVERDPETGKRVVHEVIGETALCPRCGIDSVLGDASGLQLTDEFMKAMQLHWFKEGIVDVARE